MAAPLKILVRTPNWIGDHVMAMPFYRGLRQSYPQAEIVFLCAESISSLDDTAHCNRKLVLAQRERHFSTAFWKRARQLRLEKFDLSISLPASFSSGALLAMVGARERIGFLADTNNLFLTAGIPWRGRSAGKHKSQLYLELLEFLTGKHHELNSEVRLLHKPKNHPKRILIAPGASISLREWPYFDVLIKKLAIDFPTYKIGLVGGQKEKAWSERLKAFGLPLVEDWIGKTDLPQLVTLCQESDLVIANDSGVAHIAASLALSSTLVLYGPGDPDYIAPQGPRVTGIRVERLACSPCEKPYCRAPYGYKACLNELSMDRVFQQVKELLTKLSL